MYIVPDGTNLKEKSREELILIIRQYMDMERRNEFMEKESSRAQSAMAKEFQSMKKRMEAALSENQQMKEQMARLAEQNCLKTRDAFGRRTERLSDLLSSAPAGDEVDESGTEDLPENDELFDNSAAAAPHTKKHGKKKQRQAAERSVRA